MNLEELHGCRCQGAGKLRSPTFGVEITNFWSFCFTQLIFFSGVEPPIEFEAVSFFGVGESKG